MYDKIIQFIKFGFVGASNNIIYFIIYYILLFMNIDYIIANIFGYTISSFSGYILNKKWVFKGTEEKTTESIIKYYIVYGSSFVINILCMYICVDVLNLSKVIAPILTMCITIPYNFILNKFWTFKN